MARRSYLPRIGNNKKGPGRKHVQGKRPVQPVNKQAEEEIRVSEEKASML